MTYLLGYMYFCTAFSYTFIYIMAISTSSDVLCMDLWKMNKRIERVTIYLFSLIYA
jgi:hypothetical protein